MATRAEAGAQAGISPPEPDLTPQEMIDRAIALRPLLREQSADTERRARWHHCATARRASQATSDSQKRLVLASRATARAFSIKSL